MKIFSKGWFLLKELVLLTVLFISDIPAEGQSDLLPVPQNIGWTSEKFYFIENDPFSDPRIRKVTVGTIDDARLNMDEAYRLIVRSDSVLVQATGKEGFFRAKATPDSESGFST